MRVALVISFVTGIYLDDASDVPELSAKYFARPGQHIFFLPCQRLLPPVGVHFIIRMDRHPAFEALVEVAVSFAEAVQDLVKIVVFAKFRFAVR